jgi:hypothetical protein
MAPLRNWKHEAFTQLIAEDVNAEEAYARAGFRPHRANYRRLLRRPEVAARVEEIRHKRQASARAARVPIDQILTEFDRHGVNRFEDLFDRDQAGIPRVRDLQRVPVEMAIALLRFLREAFRIDDPV